MSCEIGVVLITHAARHHLPHCIPALQASPLKPRILVVNSTSNDGTLEQAQALGAETWSIPRCQFNHGLTREAARKRLGTPFVVMMTPDAYPVDHTLLEKLTEPLRNGKAAASYARQLPHPNADLFEAFPRKFHYSTQSRLYQLYDLEKPDALTFFFSNSCSAYIQSALDQVGGFRHVLMGEDTLMAGELLKAGYSLAYVAEAQVYHSHRYGLREEFFRHFDIGAMRHQLAHYGHARRMDRQRGWIYARALLRDVAKTTPKKLPYALLHLFSKWSGYQLGHLCPFLPKSLCRKFSSQEFYWDYPHEGVP